MKKRDIVEILKDDMQMHYKEVNAEKRLAYNITKKNEFVNPLPCKTK